MQDERRAARVATLWASAHGLCSVAMGAFGAHGLKAVLSPEALGWVETGARYQMYAALALLGLAALRPRLDARLSRFATLGFALGALVFAGSLYALALTGVRALGAVTPFGGAGLLAGFLLLGLSAWRGGSTR